MDERTGPPPAPDTRAGLPSSEPSDEWPGIKSGPLAARPMAPSREAGAAVGAAPAASASAPAAAAALSVAAWRASHESENGVTTAAPPLEPVGSVGSGPPSSSPSRSAARAGGPCASASPATASAMASSWPHSASACARTALRSESRAPRRATSSAWCSSELAASAVARAFRGQGGGWRSGVVTLLDAGVFSGRDAGKERAWVSRGRGCGGR
jgi:hypothetical protein